MFNGEHMSFLCAECADAREKKHTHTQDNNNMKAYTKREGEEKRSRVVVKEIKIKKNVEAEKEEEERRSLRLWPFRGGFWRFLLPPHFRMRDSIFVCWQFGRTYTHVIKAKSGQNYAHNNIFNERTNEPTKYDNSLAFAYTFTFHIHCLPHFRVCVCVYLCGWCVLAEGKSTIEHITKAMPMIIQVTYE